MNQSLRTALSMAVCVTLSACAQASPEAAITQSAPASTTAPAAAAKADAPGFTATSEVSGLHATALGTLPAAKGARAFSEGHFCSFISKRPETAGGKDAASKGWTVTSEVKSGELTSVGIFSRGEEGTSGTCMVQDGNIAVYKGQQLLGLVYGDTPEADSLSPIGGIIKTQIANRVRIGDFTPANYLSADIELSETGMKVVPLAASENYCGLDVPNLYGKEVPQARALLAKSGWKPSPPREEGDAPPSGHLSQEPEIADCSGTGYGFCSGGYAHKSGAFLSFTTAGDGPATIVSYGVNCPNTK